MQRESSSVPYRRLQHFSRPKTRGSSKLIEKRIETINLACDTRKHIIGASGSLLKEDSRAINHGPPAIPVGKKTTGRLSSSWGCAPASLSWRIKDSQIGGMNREKRKVSGHFNSLYREREREGGRREGRRWKSQEREGALERETPGFKGARRRLVMDAGMSRGIRHADGKKWHCCLSSVGVRALSPLRVCHWFLLSAISSKEL